MTRPAAGTIVRHAGEGDAFWWLGALVTLKLTAVETAGALSAIEVDAPAGFSVPLHVHEREDEVLHVIEGEATFEVGGQVLCLGAGATVRAPRGAPHRYVVGAEPSRLIAVFTPGGFDGVIRASGVPARRRTWPPSGRSRADEERLRRVAAEHGISVLG